MRKLFVLVPALLLLTGCNLVVDNAGVVDQGEDLVYELGYEHYSGKATFRGGGMWDYEITGEMPTPCHEFTAQAVVGESFPEVVVIQVTQIDPEPDQVCAQVVDIQTATGIFQASELATVNMVWVNE